MSQPPKTMSSSEAKGTKSLMRGVRDLGSLAKPNRAHLCQRPDRLRKALADRVDAGNRRRADCAETHEQHAEFAVGRRDMKWCGHNRPLYH